VQHVSVTVYSDLHGCTQEATTLTCGATTLNNDLGSTTECLRNQTTSKGGSWSDNFQHEDPSSSDLDGNTPQFLWERLTGRDFCSATN